MWLKLGKCKSALEPIKITMDYNLNLEEALIFHDHSWQTFLADLNSEHDN